MGNPRGFIEYRRQDAPADSVQERIKNYNEFHTPLSEQEQKVQGERCMHCGVPFCQSGMVIGKMFSGCPLNNLIPEWNELVSRGAWKQAYDRLKLTNSFPEFTSRVCPALCEKACTCGANGDPVTVRANEYSVIETAYAEGYARPQIPSVRTGKKIAVIGSGPSGLAAADMLNRRGHSVTVFERSDRVGGLLMYGIPNMKLEKRIIERRIDIMKQEGVVFRTGVNVGTDVAAVLLRYFYTPVEGDNHKQCAAQRHKEVGPDAGFLGAVTALKADGSAQEGGDQQAEYKVGRHEWLKVRCSSFSWRVT